MPKNKTNWKQLVERDAETLIVYWMIWGRYKHYEKLIGSGYKPKQFKYENKWYWEPEEELKEEYLALKKTVDEKGGFLDRLEIKMIKAGDNLVKIAKKASVVNGSETKEELEDLFKQFNSAIESFIPLVWVFFPAQRLLTQYINEGLKNLLPNSTETQLNRAFTLLTTSREETSTAKEYQELLRLAMNYQKEKLKEVYQEYSWLGAARVGWSYLNKPYNFKHYQNIIKELVKSEPEKKLKEIKEKKKAYFKNYRDFLKERKPPEELIKSAEILQKYIFLHTLRGEQIVRALLYTKLLLKEIASRFNLKLEDIIYLTPPEIVTLLKTGKIPNFIPRKRGYSILIKGGKTIIKGGARAKKIKVEKLKMLKGRVAQLGFAKGRVRIILSEKEIGKVKKGDILVTTMTNPNYVIAMHRASAIITDEGGITCHAAILSREFGIPCIVGTKNATKILKDNDLVKVDAEKGIIKIIKR